MALFDLGFAHFWFLINSFFEGLHNFHSKFTEGQIIVEFRSCSKSEIIGYNLTSYGPFFNYVLPGDTSDFRNLVSYIGRHNKKIMKVVSNGECQ